MPWLYSAAMTREGEAAGAGDFLTTKEVAAYLRIKERRVYELVRQRAIPCTRVTGKWLFPKALIDVWLAEGVDGEAAVRPPPVIAGSQDPLLDWAVKESGCGLALLAGGSLDGLNRDLHAMSKLGVASNGSPSSGNGSNGSGRNDH